MSGFSFEEYTRVAFVDTISDINAPTVAELTAGTDLSEFISKDGLSTPSNQNFVDTATITTHFDSQRPGSFGGPISLKMKRDNVANDDAYTLYAWGDEGFIVIRYGILFSTGWAAAQRVEVYPVQAHEPIMSNSAANEEATFTQQFAVTSAPDKTATVAAS